MQRNPYWPLNGPSFFFDHRDSVTAYFTHCPSRAVGFGLKFCGADGKPTQLREYALTRTRSPAGESFVRDCFDFVQTTQDPDVHGTTSTVTALIRLIAELLERGTACD